MSQGIATPVRARSTGQFTRNATLEDLVGLLEYQQDRKLDVVISADAIRAENGALLLDGMGEVETITENGVTTGPGVFRPTDVADQGIADKLGIPAPYLRKLRSEAPELYDANVNGWLDRTDRKFMVRTLRGGGDLPGVARAFLSDQYRRIDNLDVLVATLDGVRAAGVAIRIDGADLSDRRMYVRVVAEQIKAYAPRLLAGYKSPYSGNLGSDNPTVFAGFEITNSETGYGAFTIVPRLVFQVCNNGAVMTKNAARAVHTGVKLDEGAVQWSDDTQRKTLDLITARTRDTIAAFLNPEYIEKQIRQMERQAGVELADPDTTIEVVSKQLKFTETQRAGILNHFIRGGDVTAGGVMQAITSLAQAVEDPDEAYELESSAVRAMEIAAAL